MSIDERRRFSGSKQKDGTQKSPEHAFHYALDQSMLSPQATMTCLAYLSQICFFHLFASATYGWTCDFRGDRTVQMTRHAPRVSTWCDFCYVEKTGTSSSDSWAEMTAVAAKSDFLALMENPLYAAMPAATRAAIEAKGRRIRLSAGEALFCQGDPSNGVYALLSGELEYSRTSPSGKHSILNVLNPGKWIGDLSTLDEQGRTLDCSASRDSMLMHLSKADFLVLFETMPAFSKMLLLLQSERVRQLLDWTETLTKLPAEGRLAERLCIFGQSHGKPVADGIKIDLVLSQDRLAATIGTTRQRINQILNLWVNEDLIRHDGRHLVLCNIPALRSRIDVA